MNCFIMPVRENMPSDAPAAPRPVSRADAGTSPLGGTFQSILDGLSAPKKETEPVRKEERTAGVDRQEQNPHQKETSRQKATSPSRGTERPEAEHSKRADRTGERKPQDRKDGVKAGADTRKTGPEETKTIAELMAQAGAGKAGKPDRGLVDRIMELVRNNPEAAGKLGELPAAELEQELLSWSAADLKKLAVLLTGEQRTPGIMHRLLAEKGKNMPEKADKPVSLDQLKLEEKESAFQVEVTEDGKKVRVNTSRIRVSDQRSAKAEGSREESASVKPARSEEAAEFHKGSSGDRRGPGADRFMDRQTSFRTQVLEAMERRAAEKTRDVNRTFQDLVKWAKVMISDRKSVMRLNLKPEHLGKVFLKIELVNNRISAQVFAQNAGTGDMLRENMGQLYEAFREAGLDLENLDVTTGQDGGNGENGEQGREDPFPDGFGTEDENFVLNSPKNDDNRISVLNYGEPAHALTINTVV